MNTKVAEIMRHLGNDKSKKIFMDYLEKHSDRVYEFIQGKAAKASHGSIIDNLKLSLLPKEFALLSYLQNIVKDEDGAKKMMEEFFDDEKNVDHALGFIKTHPLYEG